VYVAALTPDKGETVGDVFYRGKPHPKAPQLAPDADGLIWMPEQGFADAFAQNASSDTLAILAATQRPIALPCIQEPSPEPAWKTKPSWFLLAEEDRISIRRRSILWPNAWAQKRDPALSITRRRSRRRIWSWMSFWRL
jgi:hypothetical protein